MLGAVLPSQLLPFLLVGGVVPPVALIAMGMRSSKWTSSIQGASVGGLYLWEMGVLRPAFVSKSPLSPHGQQLPSGATAVSRVGGAGGVKHVHLPRGESINFQQLAGLFLELR